MGRENNFAEKGTKYYNNTSLRSLFPFYDQINATYWDMELLL